LLGFVFLRRQRNKRQMASQAQVLRHLPAAPQTWPDHGSYASYAKSASDESSLQMMKDQSQIHGPVELMTQKPGFRAAELDGWNGR
jgi:hypothetical protein